MRKNGVNKELRTIEGGVCAPEGFTANAVSVGIRSDGEPDFGMLFTEKRCAVACVYASTPFCGAPVRVSKRNMKYGYARAILVNSGIANCIAPDGEKLAESVCDLFARYGIERTETVIASTGKIGEKLTVAPFEKGAKPLFEGLARAPENSLLLATSMMTTDSRPKEVSYEFSLGDYPCKIGAVFKGGANVSPNMATFLAFLTTDVNISTEMLQRALSSAVRETLNQIQIDGISSPNDTVCILANGKAGNYKITFPDSEYKKFADILKIVFAEICKITVKDAKGTKTLYGRVAGAKSKKVSRALSKKLVGTEIVKKGVLKGELDVNGLAYLILCEDEPQDPARIQIVLKSSLGEVVLFEDGKAMLGLENRVKALMGSDEITISVDLGAGNFESIAYGRA